MPENVYSYVVSGTDLSSIADEIRSKTGGSSELTFPTDFVTAINGITTLEEGTQSANATANKIWSGYNAYVKGKKVWGTYTPKVKKVDLNVSRSSLSILLRSGPYIKGDIAFLFYRPNMEYWDFSKSFPHLTGSPYATYITLQASPDANGYYSQIQGYVNYDFYVSSDTYLLLNYIATAVVTLKLE